MLFVLGLYSEYLIEPYMPLEGQLVSLDYRLLHAARAFLDPELQAGKNSPAMPGASWTARLLEACTSHSTLRLWLSSLCFRTRPS